MLVVLIKGFMQPMVYCSYPNYQRRPYPLMISYYMPRHVCAVWDQYLQGQVLMQQFKHPLRVRLGLQLKESCVLQGLRIPHMVEQLKSECNQAMRKPLS
ncbi:unnamed protein product [Blumeria hordei]|uniref:Uncharacterized protein n=1 Tax=Blumeria hordei TaxID=2867405 RepID=A0A383UNK6_BLUHO|nr:unnamed protein product [Blumeria hordei]